MHHPEAVAPTTGNTALHVAVLGGGEDLEVIRLLMEHISVSIPNAGGNNKQPPLHRRFWLIYNYCGGYVGSRPIVYRICGFFVMLLKEGWILY